MQTTEAQGGTAKRYILKPRRSALLDDTMSLKLKLFLIISLSSLIMSPLLIIIVTTTPRSRRPPTLKSTLVRASETEAPPMSLIFHAHVRELITTLNGSENANISAISDNTCPTELIGFYAANKTVPRSLDEVIGRHKEIHPGGAWRPANCSARSKVAIVVPYRDREEHLRVFLNVMHHFLKKQQLDYRIYVVEQDGTAPFNRATLLNIGFFAALRAADESIDLAELGRLANLFSASANSSVNILHLVNLTQLAERYARLRNGYQCFAFHDVDLLPENDRAPYWCPIGGPRHLVTCNQKFRYRPIYDGYFGGAAVVTLEQMLKVNGLSNMYFGWGAEDDDFADRLRQFWRIAHCPPEIGRYSALQHSTLKESEKSKTRLVLWKNWKRRWQTDGLNSLQSLSLKVLSVESKPLFTHVRVHIDLWPLASV